ncbi:NTP transferase domain-containing protein [Microscilla marina]|uniref:Molybdenum cofactor biosynthesis protein C n=1 Tax=Microscilla marina ATCC 23134 TaxID=313606 RepID=A1ZUU3_MICM2|nr:NTP transferase domain-containing protein [Microscilla marina]EAY25847.1 molybdenum cofactor biosynthesis protein C [Microscilla marina ATCC 23134]
MYGLVLAGGQSRRMGTDKGALDYHGMPQRQYLYELLQNFCEKTYISCRVEQAGTWEEDVEYNYLYDRYEDLGPVTGIITALKFKPYTTWLVVACDLPYLNEETIDALIRQRNPAKIATAYVNPKNDLPEPLLTIWEPQSKPIIEKFIEEDNTSPLNILKESEVHLIQIAQPLVLTNANHPEEYKKALDELKGL